MHINIIRTMIYCKKCGVELEAGMSRCPLCGQPVSSHEGETQEDPDEYDTTLSARRKWNLRRIKQVITQAIPPLKRIFHT